MDLDFATTLQIARQAWPQTVPAVATAAPITAGRLNDQPLWRIDCGATQFAMRGWTLERLNQAALADRFVRHVALASGLDLLVPVPLQRTAELQSFYPMLHMVDGVAWQLEPWLDGEVNFESEPTRERLESMARALATLHRAADGLETPAAPSAIDRHWTEIEKLQAEIIDGRIKRLLPQAMITELREAAYIARLQLEPLRAANLPMQWVWGDAWHSNFLLRGERVVGMVDFATVRVDTRAADLARLLGAATAGKPEWWQPSVEAYMAMCPLSAVELEAVWALRDSGTVISLVNWLRWLLVERRVFPDPAAAHHRLSHFTARLNGLVVRRNFT